MSLGNNGGSISLDELVTLNEEMAALVRAGVPLDAGMAELGHDLPGKLGLLASQIGRRLNQGESLPQILADDGRTLPTVWRAVVESGLRSGDLPGALDGLELAGQACGDHVLREAGAMVAKSLRLGKSLSTSDVGLSAFPPLLGWLLAYGGQTESLSNMLREMADRYRNQAKHAANWSAVYLPIAITVVAGGTVTMLQAFAIFVPLTQLYIDIARQF